MRGLNQKDTFEHLFSWMCKKWIVDKNLSFKKVILNREKDITLPWLNLFIHHHISSMLALFCLIFSILVRTISLKRYLESYWGRYSKLKHVCTLKLKFESFLIAISMSLKPFLLILGSPVQKWIKWARSSPESSERIPKNHSIIASSLLYPLMVMWFLSSSTKIREKLPEIYELPSTREQSSSSENLINSLGSISVDKPLLKL